MEMTDNRYIEYEVMNIKKSRKIKSAEQMEHLWEEYKIYCDNQSVLTHDFSQKNSKFVSAELKRKITYTIEGFCVFAKIGRTTFYEDYAKSPKFVNIVTYMREECEVDARGKFETGQIPTQLAGLWMARHGYTTKTETNIGIRDKQQDDKLSAALKKLAEDLEKDD